MSVTRELKVGIVGCGKIADAHLSQIQRIQGAKVVGVVDAEPLMARQLCERFEVGRSFGSVTDLLAACRPHIVHITTPPQSHLEIGKQCLEAGCHVYIEKPFTLDTREANELLGLATRRGLKVTVGHDLQFSHAALRMRQLIRDGYLGGEPVHMESYYCYELNDPRYARVLLADKTHWVRRLPGKLLHNIISHGIARISEHLKTDSVQVTAQGFVSPLLWGMGEDEIVDELRVIITEERQRTAYFTFSSQMRPSLNVFRIYGPKNGIVLDEERQLVLRQNGKRFKSYAEKFIPPLALAGQHLGNLAVNVRKFLRNDFHMKSGMKHLIESFYRSIVEETPPPISYREILLTARIMDDIFEQVAPNKTCCAQLPQ